MFETIEMETAAPFGARIKVIGVGGGGGNAVNNMIAASLGNIEYVVANTDAQALARNGAGTKIQLGMLTTRGLGAGAKPEVGHKSALEDLETLRASLADADMVFITAGMGGGTGTGAAPVIAQAAREAGALTIAIVTRPFGFEGAQRKRQADEGLDELAQHVDTLIVIPNDRVLQLSQGRTPLRQAFQLVDSVLVEAVRGISDIIMTPGLINVDFADVVAIMKGRGMALMGTGRARGDDRARNAARQAISSPLLEDARIEGATGLLVSICGSEDMSIDDINEAMSLIQECAAADTNTIFGAVVDDSLGDEIKVTVVATGFDRVAQARINEMSHVRALNDVRSVRATAPLPPQNLRNPSVPPPIPEQVRVYATPSNSQMLEAAQAVTQQLPPRQRQHPNMPADFETPSFVRNTPAYGTGAATANVLGKREPKVSNPFLHEDGGEMDRPAFMRK